MNGMQDSSSWQRFFDFISISAEKKGGFGFHKLLSPSLTSCQLDADALLQLQSNMFNTFLDKMKVMSDDEIDKMVLALPNAIWNPEIARPFPFPVLFLDEFAIISWS